MRRPRFRKPATEVSLFPFLAVLICTMGGLIVLLVMVVQQARVDAGTIADTERRLREDDSSLRELQLRREEYEWRQQVLAQQRAKQTEEVGDRRLELGHLEEHLRELQARWKQLVAQADSLRSPLASDESDQWQRARERELEQLRLAIDKARQELEQARRRLADEPKSYTIIPYQGPHGTRRRPIYLECTAQGVLVQPAGILLPLADFQGPLGPGNPLDAVLRAIREHWRQGPEAGTEPYPLLLVRPDGVEAYAGARSALKAWDDEFGYELVEAELRLKYPEEDRALAPLLQETIAAARRRQSLLAAAMPSRFEGGASAGLVASSSGGFTRLSGSGSASRGGSSGSGSGRPGRGVGASGTGESGSTGSSVGSRNATGNTAASGLRGNPADSSAFNGDPTSGDPASGDSASGSGSPERRGTAASQQGRDNPRTQGQAPGQTAQASAGGQAPAGRQTPGGQPGGPAAAGHTQPGRPGNLAGGSVMGGMSETRGADWALPNSTRQATGVTRPLHIACYPDRLLILPDRGDSRPPKVVMLPANTADGVDTFVQAVWDVMDGWGLALAGGYWKPILYVQVQPNAERRFQDLQILLQGSGLDVRRKQP